MKKMNLFKLTAILSGALFLLSCSKDDNGPTPNGDDNGLQPTLLEVIIVEDLPPAENPDDPVYFSLSENKIIPADQKDTDAWDIAFSRTNILTNGGVSGPGNGGALVGRGIFEETTRVPDGTFLQDSQERLAILSGSGNGWFNYNPATFTITPIAGHILFIRTANGNYAKMEVLSYYQGAPDVPNAQEDAARYYTFRYVYQPDGSRDF